MRISNAHCFVEECGGSCADDQLPSPNVVFTLYRPKVLNRTVSIELQFYFSRFCRLRDRGAAPFIFFVSLESILLSVALDWIAQKFNLSVRTGLDDLDLVSLGLLGVVFAPLVETLLLQLLPVKVARAYGCSTLVQLFLASVPFAALHFASGLATGLGAGVVGGLYFGLTFIVWSERSYGVAFAVTAAVHAIHNLFFYLLTCLG